MSSFCDPSLKWKKKSLSFLTAKLILAKSRVTFFFFYFQGLKDLKHLRNFYIFCSRLSWLVWRKISWLFLSHQYFLLLGFQPTPHMTDVKRSGSMYLLEIDLHQWCVSKKRARQGVRNAVGGDTPTLEPILFFFGRMSHPRIYFWTELAGKIYTYISFTCEKEETVIVALGKSMSENLPHSREAGGFMEKI